MTTFAHALLAIRINKLSSVLRFRSRYFLAGTGAALFWLEPEPLFFGWNRSRSEGHPDPPVDNLTV